MTTENKSTSESEPDFVLMGDGGVIPNNPVLPVYLNRNALPTNAGAIRSLFQINGWRGTWTSTVFAHHHYHNDAHEALGVVSGWADIQLGGPQGDIFRLEAGDLVVLPAGTGHCRKNSSSDFAVCGAYPPGQENYSSLSVSPNALQTYGDDIAAVPLPQTDPAFGADGPLVKEWNAAAG